MVGEDAADMRLDLRRAVHHTAVEADDVAVLGEQRGDLPRGARIPAVQERLIESADLPPVGGAWVVGFGFAGFHLLRGEKISISSVAGSIFQSASASARCGLNIR